MTEEETIKQLQSIVDTMNLNKTININLFKEDKDAIHNAIDMIQKKQAEIEKKNKKISDLEYALLDMVMQFADRPHKNSCEYFISTMGLSALELAFSELDLDDPTPIKKANKMYEKLQEQYFEKQVESEDK